MSLAFIYNYTKHIFKIKIRSCIYIGLKFVFLLISNQDTILSYKLMWWRKESLAVFRVTVGGRAQWFDLISRVDQMAVYSLVFWAD
jgi:hypothetical protein